MISLSTVTRSFSLVRSSRFPLVRRFWSWDKASAVSCSLGSRVWGREGSSSTGGQFGLCGTSTFLHLRVSLLLDPAADPQISPALPESAQSSCLRDPDGHDSLCPAQAQGVSHQRLGLCRLALLPSCETTPGKLEHKFGCKYWQSFMKKLRKLLREMTKLFF